VRAARQDAPMLSLLDLHSLLSAKTSAVRETPFRPGIVVYKIGGKMFAIAPETGAASLTLKCDPALAEALRGAYAAISPGYHTNKRHWITIRQDADLPDDEIARLIDHAYDLVRAGLTRAAKAVLAADEAGI
jgi:predicted DNA-binding protein (MmcQ/YjbR family)